MFILKITPEGLIYGILLFANKVGREEILIPGNSSMFISHTKKNVHHKVSKQPVAAQEFFEGASSGQNAYLCKKKNALNG